MASNDRKGNDEPWLGESSYGDEPTEDPYFTNLGDYERQRRNQIMIRMRDGYMGDTGASYYNDRGRAVPVRNKPRVVGRSWACLEDFSND